MPQFYLEFEKPIEEIEKSIQDLSRSARPQQGVDFSIEITELEKKRNTVMENIYRSLSPWQIVQISRHPERPLFSDYRKHLFENFIEIHGERQFRDDPAIVCGLAVFQGRKVMVIGQDKGKDTKEKIYRNFGMPQPEGYRKALRAMRLAEKFKLPVMTFIDTAGAYPGIEGEERGQGEAIARNLFEMSGLKTPVVSLVIGEGGSGGALGIAVSDRILMLSNSYYSVISPESCASILWHDATRAAQAAEALKLIAPELLRFGIIEEIVPEPLGGAHRDVPGTMSIVSEALKRHLDELVRISPVRLVQKRYERFRKLGAWERKSQSAVQKSVEEA